MTKSIKFTFDQALELVEDPHAINTNSDTSYRHGSYETYVVPFDGKYYEFIVSVSKDGGWDSFDTVVAYEVYEVEVVSTEWWMVQ